MIIKLHTFFCTCINGNFIVLYNLYRSSACFKLIKVHVYKFVIISNKAVSKWITGSSSIFFIKYMYVINVIKYILIIFFIINSFKTLMVINWFKTMKYYRFLIKFKELISASNCKKTLKYHLYCLRVKSNNK